MFGISWGGAMAQQFARQHGRRTRRLILAATSAGMVSFPGKVSALLEMAGPLRHLRPGRTKGGSAGVIYGGEFRRNLALARKVAPFFADAGSSGYYFQVLAGAGWTSAHWLSCLKQPTLVLAGEDDPLVPLPNAKLLARLIPNARLVTYPCGHLFIVSHLDQVAAEVRKFLS